MFTKGMRKPRELKEGAQDHVTAQVNRQEFIFADEQIKQMMDKVLHRAKEKFTYSISSYDIMSSHIHLIIKPLRNNSLSKIMQWILSVFAKKYNRLMGLKGHVWCDRFASKIIKTVKQYINTFRYILKNPVKARIVRDTTEYPHSSGYCIRRFLHDIVDPPDGIVKIFFPEVLPLLLEKPSRSLAKREL